MTARRRPHDDQLLAEVVERQGRAIEALAARVIELGADMDELRPAHHAKRAPPGKTALKVAAAASGWSYQACKRLCASNGRAIGAVRRGGRWFVDEAMLLAFLSKRR